MSKGPVTFSPREPRVAAVMTVEFRTPGQFLVAYCTNISRGGLFVSTPDPAAVGDVVSLSLRVPGSTADLPLQARVRWVRASDAGEGPAGMGLSFESIDAALGEHIDRLVAKATTLRVDLVGGRDHAWRHIESLVRSMMTCETRALAPETTTPADVIASDLVLVDGETEGDLALALLTELASLSHAPPRIALIAGRSVDRRARASATGARVVATPVDKVELQRTVLECLAQGRGVAGP